MAADTVTVRELRQNLSVFLRRVEHGETLSVTNRGRAVAVLGPLPGAGDPIDRLEAEGRIARRATLDILDLGPPPKPEPGEMSISEALDEQREDRI
jgi:prevent-host-death family protein